nr:precorrin-2 C(20)-methyltransferase [uncultured Carboxylicivirga sp.]
MKNKYPITGVALGPGDPDLITVKGLKALQNADVIYYAATPKGERTISFSKRILDYYNLDVVCKPLMFPMTGENRDQFYQQAFDILQADYKTGLKVVMVTEGDLSFYSTFGYIMKLAKKNDVPVISIAGVPAFLAGIAQTSMPLVDGNHSFLNIARPKSFEQIQKSIDESNAVVVMKMNVLKGWYDFLKRNNRSFVYVEKVGTDEQFITTNFEDLEERKIPYFSLIIFPGVE